MFDVDKRRLFPYTSPLIADGFRALLLDDDDTPLVFVGTNEDGDRIIGSSVEEDHKKGIERFFHAVVSEDDYSAYFGRKKSLRQIYESASPLFVIDKNAKKGTHTIYHYKFSEIPENYRPSDKALIPQSAYAPSNVFKVPITGGIADQNRALPDDASEAQKKIAEWIDAGLQTLQRHVKIVTSTFAKPATVGSYEINFEVELEEYPYLYVTPEECWDYLNSYLKYCIEDLPKEVSSLDSPTARHAKFSSLTEKATSLAKKLGGSESVEKDVQESVLNDVLESPRLLQDVATIVSSGYSAIRIANNDFPLGKIDAVYGETAKEVVVQAAHITKPTLQDSTLRDYKIHVYDFNKNTGGGLAYLHVSADEQPVIRFAIPDYDPLVSAEKFTGSEHYSRVIAVRGRLTRIKGVPKKLTIQQEKN